MKDCRSDKTNRQPPKTPSEYFRSVFTNNNTVVHRPLHQITSSKLDSLFLSDLINITSYENLVWDENYEYFLCTIEFLYSYGHWTNKDQEHRLKSLIKNKFIKTKRKGIPSKRWIKIEIETIELQIENARYQKKVLSTTKMSKEEVKNLLTNRNMQERPNGCAQSPPFGGDCSPPNGGVKDNKLNKYKIHCRKSDSATPNRFRDGALEIIPMKSFIQEVAPEQTTTTLATKDDEDSASKLRSIATKAGFAGGWKRKTWAEWLSKTRNKYSNFYEVFDWYCLHWNEKYTPKAFCGKTFYTKFLAIAGAMARTQSNNVKVEVSSDSIKVAKRLSSLNWPKGSEDQLACAIQICRDRCHDLKCKFVSYTQRPNLDRKKFNLALYASTQLSNSIDFAERWIRQAHSKAKWEKFDGNLLKDWILFNDCHKDFVAMGRSWADYKTDKSLLWDELMREIRS